MNKQRLNTTDTLRELGTLVQSHPDSPVSAEDIEGAKHLTALSRKNDQGTLSIKEAAEIRDLLEEENAIIIDLGNERWVETG